MKRLLPVPLLLVACEQAGRSPEPRYAVDGLGLELPQLTGWIRDPETALSDPAKGGTALRLVREKAVPGSPRIDVEVEPLPAHPTRLDTFLNRNLREMAKNESSGQIHILAVDRRPAQIGPRRAYRVRHEYTLGTGSKQLAITQVSTLLVLDGRGIAITAYGRTELFHPLASAIDHVLGDITIPAPGGQTPVAVEIIPVPPGRTQSSDPTANPDVEPVDLGKVGGR